MNIMLITHQGGTAGSTYSIFYLARGLSERGHNVYLGATQHSRLYQMSLGTKINLIPMTFNKKRPFINARQIRAAVEAHNIELVNAQSNADRYSSFIAKYIYKTNFKVIHTRRQTPLSSGGKLQGWFYTKTTDRVVAVSQGVKEKLVKLGIANQHIDVINNGTPDDKYHLIDEGVIQSLREKHSINDNTVVIGCISRMKRQTQLIEAMKNFGKNVKLILVGINHDRWEPCRKMISQYGLEEQVIHVGYADQKTTLNYYKLFDVKVLCSVTEGLSQALLEAMYLGVPVVATNAAGNPDLIKDGVNGLLFEDEAIDELTTKIKLVIGNPEIKQRLIVNGQKSARQDFSIDRVVDNYEALFKKVIDES